MGHVNEFNVKYRGKWYIGYIYETDSTIVLPKINTVN